MAMMMAMVATMRQTNKQEHIMIKWQLQYGANKQPLSKAMNLNHDQMNNAAVS